MALTYLMKRLSAILILAVAARSQNFDDLCNSSISNANASGIFTIPTSFAPESENETRYPSWAVTVHGGNGNKVNRNLWYDTAGENYADDLTIDYDVCTFIIADLSTNAYRLGQQDSGNCSTMITDRCKTSVEDMATVSANKWVTYSTPPPWQNLTGGVLPYICRYILEDLQDTMRENCSGQLREYPKLPKYGDFTTPVALTGHNESIIYSSNCTLSAGDKTFRPVGFGTVGYPDRDTGNDIGYDNATHEITPALTVYMAVANVERSNRQSIWRAQSIFQCLRASNISEASRVPLELPEGTPLPTRSGLGAAAKGGITAGVVIFVLAVGGLLLWLWIARRKKRARAGAAVQLHSDAMSSDDDKNLPPEADGSGGFHELTSHDRKPELDSVQVSELGGGIHRASELADTPAPVELPAENNGHQARTRY